MPQGKKSPNEGFHMLDVVQKSQNWSEDSLTLGACLIKKIAAMILESRASQPISS